LNYFGGGTFSTSFTPTSATSFFGFTVNGPITSLVLNAPSSNRNVVGKLTVGTSLASVPEPSTFVLGGVLAGAGLAAWRVRRARSRKAIVA
jgi:hypothetical protein